MLNKRALIFHKMAKSTRPDSAEKHRVNNDVEVNEKFGHQTEDPLR